LPSNENIFAAPWLCVQIHIQTCLPFVVLRSVCLLITTFPVCSSPTRNCILMQLKTSVIIGCELLQQDFHCREY